MLEREFQRKVIRRLKDEGFIVLKNDGSNVPQGFPDVTIIGNRKDIRFIEFKRNLKASYRPNQLRWIQRLRDKGYNAMIITPDNEDDLWN